MDAYDKMLNLAYILDIQVIEKNFKSSAKGLCKGNKIGISKSLEHRTEKRCILAEEISHSIYTDGNILDQSDIRNIKQEYFARKKTYEFLLPLSKLIDAALAGLCSCFELAEFLEVTEEFLKSALYYYQNKFGICAYHEKYIIYFSPLIVCERTHI